MEKRNPPVRQKSASPPGGFYNLGTEGSRKEIAGTCAWNSRFAILILIEGRAVTHELSKSVVI